MTGITLPVPSTAGPAGQALVRGHLAGAAASACLALAWLVLSWWHPALTYHFGPPLAAGAWPVLLRARLRQRVPPSHALAAVSGGFLMAIAALGIAVAGNWLRGPTLIGAGSVPAEEVALAVAAAAWGWRVAERCRRAWFLPAEPSQPDGLPASPAEPAPGNGPRRHLTSPAINRARTVRKLTGTARSG